MYFDRDTVIDLYCPECDEWVYEIPARIENGMCDLKREEDGYCPECDALLQD